MDTIDFPLYRIRDVRFSYDFGNLKAPALNGVSLDIGKGDFVCMTGPSGTGKTTLLNLLGLIKVVQDGDIQFNANSLKTLTEKEKIGSAAIISVLYSRLFSYFRL